MLCFSHLAAHEDNACLVKTRLLPFCIIIQVSSLRSPLPISVFVGNMWSVLVSLATKACHAHTSITNSGVTGMILMWIPTRNPAGGLVWGGGGGALWAPQRGLGKRPGMRLGTTLGQRAPQVSMLGRTSDAASNININLKNSWPLPWTSLKNKRKEKMDCVEGVRCFSQCSVGCCCSWM